MAQRDEPEQVVQGSLFPEQYPPKTLRLRSKQLRALVVALLRGEHEQAA